MQSTHLYDQYTLSALRPKCRLTRQPAIPQEEDWKSVAPHPTEPIRNSSYPVPMPVVHLSELAVGEADQYIKAGKTDKDEKQTIDCVLINSDNVGNYSTFSLKE